MIASRTSALAGPIVLALGSIGVVVVMLALNMFPSQQAKRELPAGSPTPPLASPSVTDTPTTTVAKTNGVARVHQAMQMAVAMGFKDPIYIGVEMATEGLWPKLEVTALGGKRVKLLIRTNEDGGMELQPDTVIFRGISSADDLADEACKAVWDWENRGSVVTPKPKDQEGWGEYESLEFSAKELRPYAFNCSRGGSSDEERKRLTDGWPTKTIKPRD